MSIAAALAIWAFERHLEMELLFGTLQIFVLVMWPKIGDLAYLIAV